MSYHLDLGPWNGVFAVPNALVDRHIKLAGKEQLQAILWMLRHSGESVSAQALGAALGISPDSAADALEYWVDRGLLARREETLFPLESPQVSPSPQAAAAPAPDTEKPKEKKPLPRKRLAKPDTGYLSRRMEESEEIRYLMREAEGALGLLSPATSGVLLAARDDYGLPVEVIIMLVNYAKSVGKTAAVYLDTVARDWAESGVTTLEAAEEKMQQLDERRLAWSRVSAIAGLSKRSPSKKEGEAALRWVREWGFGDEMLSLAYERCAERTGKFSTAYMDKVLADWHGKGLRTREDLERFEQQRRGEESKGKTYDIDEVESLFDTLED